MQQQVNKVIVDIEQATSKAQQDVEYAQKSTASLTQIESNFAWLAGFVKTIVASNEEALVAITQAAKGVEQTARMAEETGAAAEEAASSADEQARGLEQLAEAVAEIATLADELRNV